jgi:hypothetical protein
LWVPIFVFPRTDSWPRVNSFFWNMIQIHAKSSSFFKWMFATIAICLTCGQRHATHICSCSRSTQFWFQACRSHSRPAHFFEALFRTPSLSKCRASLLLN